MIAEFCEFCVTRGPWSLVWEDIGEGNCGDYDADDPHDVHRLRATLEFRGGSVDDGSYCTLATPETPPEELRAMAEALLSELGDDLVSFRRRTMQEWTWTTGNRS